MRKTVKCEHFWTCIVGTKRHLIQKQHLFILGLHMRDCKKLEMCSFPSGFCNTIIGNAIQNPVCPGGRICLLLCVPMFPLNLSKWASRIWMFEGHPVSHFAHSSLKSKQCHIDFGLVIPQEAPNYCDISVPYCFLHSSVLLREFLALYDLHYLWSDKGSSFEFYHKQFRKESTWRTKWTIITG